MPARRSEPALVAFEPGFVAQPQIFVTDALRARQQRIHELLRLERVGISAADHLEPFHRVARGVLDAGDVDARELPRRRRAPAGISSGVSPSSLNCLASSIASSSASLVPEPMAKCAVCAASPISTTWLLPLKWLHPPQIRRPKIEPGRAAQMPRIADQPAPSSISAEQIFAEFYRPLFVGGVEAVRLEDVFGRFDDEGRGFDVEFVDMRLKPAVFGPAEIEGEGVVALVGAEPDVAVGPHRPCPA